VPGEDAKVIVVKVMGSKERKERERERERGERERERGREQHSGWEEEIKVETVSPAASDIRRNRSVRDEGRERSKNARGANSISVPPTPSLSLPHPPALSKPRSAVQSSSSSCLKSALERPPTAAQIQVSSHASRDKTE
jgi:hypothetical protein